MPRQSKPLTDRAIKTAQPGDKLRKLSDGQGLYLAITPEGARYWRLKYHYAGREKLLALGVYPEVSLAEARKARDDARALLRQGKDPGAERRATRDAAKREADGGFATVTRTWLESKKPQVAATTYRKAEYVMDQYLIPALRHCSIATLSTKDATRAIEKVAESSPTLAEKARQYLGQLVDYAIKRGLRDEGKLLSLRGSVPKHEKGHIAAATKLAEIAPLLRRIDAYDSPVTRKALMLAMLTAHRPGVVVAAEWSEMDLDAGEWHTPAAKMKTRNDHIVPLPTQAVTLLKELHPLTGRGQYVFPAQAKQKTPHLHRDALSNALRRMLLKSDVTRFAASQGMLRF